MDGWGKGEAKRACCMKMTGVCGLCGVYDFSLRLPLSQSIFFYLRLFYFYLSFSLKIKFVCV